MSVMNNFTSDSNKVIVTAMHPIALTLKLQSRISTYNNKIAANIEMQKFL